MAAANLRSCKVSNEDYILAQNTSLFAKMCRNTISSLLFNATFYS